LAIKEFFANFCSDFVWRGPFKMIKVSSEE
jgi:hypothetical protein